MYEAGLDAEFEFLFKFFCILSKYLQGKDNRLEIGLLLSTIIIFQF